jgi:hypothetical protein
VDVVEISPAVLRLDPLFANDNDYVLTDHRVGVYSDDGLGFLRATPRRYDVIISEPSNPWIAGVGDLFTVEFLRLCRDRLTPDGLFTFWFHTYAQSDDTTRLLLRTLGTVFPHVELFADMQLGNIVAVAFPTRADIDFDRVERRFREPAVARDLERIALPNLVALLSLHVTSQSGPDSLAGPGPVNTLARERLRYAGPRAMFWGVDSFFLEARSPMLRDPALPPEAGAAPSLQPSMIDRYAKYRAAKGDPLRAAELVIAADWAEDRGGYGPAAGRVLRAQAEKLEKPSPP